MTNTPQVDLFILHSEADDKWVAHWLIPRLTEAGITTATREDFHIGRTVALNYEEAVDRSRYVAFVLSPGGLEDRWAAFAASLALHRDPANLTERLLPLLLRPCPELPTPLRDLTPADFGDEGGSEAEMQKLIATLQSERRQDQRSVPVSFSASLSRLLQSVKRHPLRAVGGAIAAILLFVFAVYNDSGAQAKYPLFPTNTPVPSATSSPTAQPTVTPAPTQTPLPTPTPLAFLPAAEGETLIVITEFIHRDGADDTDPAGEIAIAIREAAKELDFTTLRVEVEPTQLGRLERAAAEALGKRYNAAIVIWGEVSTVAVTTNFLNLSEPELPAADVTIRETERTQSRQQLEGIPVYSEYITENLPGQLTFLAFFAVGNSYYQAEDFGTARVAFAQSLAALPDDAVLEGRDIAFFSLAFTEQVTSAYEEAVIHYNEAIRINPVLAIAFFNRGNAFQSWGESLKKEKRLQKYADAVTSFDEAIRIKPIYANAYFNRGTVLQSWGESLKEDERLAKYTEAVTSYDNAVRIDPEFAIAYYNRGTVLQVWGDSLAGDERLNKYVQAVASYDEAVRIAPVFPSAYNNRGTALEDWGDTLREDERLDKYMEAVSSYNEAIRFDPAFALAFHNRGMAFKKWGDNLTDEDRLEKYEQSVASYNEAIRIFSSYKSAYTARGTALWEWGNNLTGEERLVKYAAAIASYSEALRIDPADSATYYNRGAVYWSWGIAYGESGRFSQAVERMQVFVETLQKLNHPDLEKFAEVLDEYHRRATVGE